MIIDDDNTSKQLSSISLGALDFVTKKNEDLILSLNTLISRNQALEEENKLLKKQSRSSEAESKKQIALLQQTLELKEQEFNELKVSQEQIKKMNEAIMSTFSELNPNVSSIHDKINKELEMAIKLHNRDMNQFKIKANDTINNYELENKKLKEKLNEVELEQKTFNILVSKERIIQAQKMNELEIQNTSCIKQLEQEKAKNKDMELTNKDLVIKCTELKCEIERLKNDHQKDIEQLIIVYEKKIKELEIPSANQNNNNNNNLCEITNIKKTSKYTSKNSENSCQGACEIHESNKKISTRKINKSRSDQDQDDNLNKAEQEIHDLKPQLNNLNNNSEEKLPKEIIKKDPNSYLDKEDIIPNRLLIASNDNFIKIIHVKDQVLNEISGNDYQLNDLEIAHDNYDDNASSNNAQVDYTKKTLNSDNQINKNSKYMIASILANKKLPYFSCKVQGNNNHQLKKKKCSCKCSCESPSMSNSKTDRLDLHHEDFFSKNGLDSISLLKELNDKQLTPNISRDHENHNHFKNSFNSSDKMYYYTNSYNHKKNSNSMNDHDNQSIMKLNIKDSNDKQNIINYTSSKEFNSRENKGIITSEQKSKDNDYIKSKKTNVFSIPVTPLGSTKKKEMSQSTQNFSIGKNIKTPHLNEKYGLNHYKTMLENIQLCQSNTYQNPNIKVENMHTLYDQFFKKTDRTNSPFPSHLKSANRVVYSEVTHRESNRDVEDNFKTELGLEDLELYSSILAKSTERELESLMNTNRIMGINKINYIEVPEKEVNQDNKLSPLSNTYHEIITKNNTKLSHHDHADDSSGDSIRCHLNPIHDGSGNRAILYENNQPVLVTLNGNMSTRSLQESEKKLKNQFETPIKINDMMIGSEKKINMRKNPKIKKLDEIEIRIEELELKNKDTQLERDKVRLEVEKLKLEIEAAKFESQKQETIQKGLESRITIDESEFYKTKNFNADGGSSSSGFNSTNKDDIIDSVGMNTCGIQHNTTDNAMNEKENAYKTEIKFLINNLLKTRNKLEKRNDELHSTPKYTTFLANTPPQKLNSDHKNRHINTDDHHIKLKTNTNINPRLKLNFSNSKLNALTNCNTCSSSNHNNGYMSNTTLSNSSDSISYTNNGSSNIHNQDIKNHIPEKDKEYEKEKEKDKDKDKDNERKLIKEKDDKIKFMNKFFKNKNSLNQAIENFANINRSKSNIRVNDNLRNITHMSNIKYNINKNNDNNTRNNNNKVPMMMNLNNPGLKLTIDASPNSYQSSSIQSGLVKKINQCLVVHVYCNL